MQSWVNYHSHTRYDDGNAEPIEYIKKAIEIGMPAYGYSAHAPVNFNTDWCVPQEKFNQYKDAIKKIKDEYGNKLQIYQGLEIDYIPDIAGKNSNILKDTELDYFIGSIHFVDRFQNDDHWNIDTSLELFKKGLISIFDNNIRKAATRYFELTRQMIEEDQPDIIGHMDKIKMFNTKLNLFDETDKWYRDQVNLTIQCIKKSGGIVEINTRGYYRYNQPELYPSLWIVNLLNKAGIPLMINSDSHKPNEIVAGMTYCAKKLKKLPVEKIFALYNNKWKEFLFNENGLIFP
ncbi:MAG: histidinol-phosphatase [Bacteroidales bacterium]|nr:histidinol-phosphatase [Bacteroidales bacterium]